MSAAAAVASRGRAATALSPARAMASLAALALFSALHWAALLVPAAVGPMVACTALALAAAAAWRRTAGLGRPWRVPTAALTALAGVALALLAAGVPLELLRPRSWGELLSGIGQGLQAMPGIGVPYRGIDPWVRIDVLAGGGMLLLGAAALAVRALHAGRRPTGAAVVLATLYAVPVVEHAPGAPFLSGAGFTVLLAAFLWADRLERPHAGTAVTFVAVAVLAGVALAPRLDGSRPLLDYQAVVEALAPAKATTYRWNHAYGPLDWPRDGRVVLRVAAREPIYWKAIALDRFDGIAWRALTLPRPSDDAALVRAHPEWRERLRVSVRDLRSAEYIAGGATLAISHSPSRIREGPSGTYLTGRRQLNPGDSYAAEVYAPQPQVLDMAVAGTAYPPSALAYLDMELPVSVGGPAPAPNAPSSLGPETISFAPFGQPGSWRSEQAVLASQYAPAYRLATRLRDAAGSPYRFARAIERRLASFAYTERPPAARRGRPPLVSFLFDTHAGYCQHFAGAMALLLRMGGVPARVASGFTSGSYDNGRREWVVHDSDAHSWVEAFFPGIGWVPFDPTPPVAPPKRQIAGAPAPAGAIVRSLDQGGRRADAPKGHPSAGAPAATPRGSSSGWAVAVGGGLLALTVAGVAVLALRRRRSTAAVSAELAELQRALELTGRPPEPPLTLRGLERRLARHSPAAGAYVAAVSRARYGPGGAPPTRAQRAALRRELADGLGPMGALRAWWALPPGRARRA